MANPARRYDETDPAARATDPANPVPPLATDPATDPRYRAANDPRVDNTVVQSRGAGNGVLIAALVIVLAVIAYFIFAPGTPDTTVPADDAAIGETTAPDATAPADTGAATTAPADDTTAPAPDATAPAAPADGATTAPESTAPADTAPADAAPAETAPAPAQ